MIHISVLSGSLSDIISSTNLPVACFCMRTLQINTDVKHVPCVTCRGRSKSRSGGRRGRTTRDGLCGVTRTKTHQQEPEQVLIKMLLSESRDSKMLPLNLQRKKITSMCLSTPCRPGNVNKPTNNQQNGCFHYSSVRNFQFSQGGEEGIQY